MNLSRPFISRPVATTLLAIGIALAGAFAFVKLPVAPLPQVDFPTIQVTTLYPGASPEVMTSAITAPLERQFGQMSGLSQMTSTSSGGASVITLQFGLDLSLDVAEQEVQAAINAALRRLGYDTRTEITGHGFRAMARTILHEELEQKPEVIEHQLAHAVPDNLGGAYNRTRFIKERRAMMQKWADYLDQIKAGAEVIPITAAR